MYNNDFETHLKSINTMYCSELSSDASDWSSSNVDRLGTQCTFEQSSLYILKDGSEVTDENTEISNDSEGRLTKGIHRGAQLEVLLKNAYDKIDSLSSVYIGTDYSSDTGYTNDYVTFRTYPGKDTTLVQIDPNAIDYDPTKRGWYDIAVTDSVKLTSPYTDATTGVWMVTFSLKEESYFGQTRVVGADMVLSEIQTLVTDVSFYTSGFAMLLQYDSTSRDNDPNVIVYGSSTLTSLKTLSELDSSLQNSGFAVDIKSKTEGPISYTRGDLGKWMGGFGVFLTVHWL
eukprot:UN25328